MLAGHQGDDGYSGIMFVDVGLPVDRACIFGSCELELPILTLVTVLAVTSIMTCATSLIGGHKCSIAYVRV